MAQSRMPSLSVLSGPLAGTKFVLEEAVDNILIGSDPSCRFVVDAPGVSPIHARVWVDLGGATVYDTNSPRGIYVNDDRVVREAQLRPGDVLWLGPPGEEESVLIQFSNPGLAGGAGVSAGGGSGDTEAASTLVYKGGDLADQMAAAGFPPPDAPAPGPGDEVVRPRTEVFEVLPEEEEGRTVVMPAPFEAPKASPAAASQATDSDFFIAEPPGDEPPEAPEEVPEEAEPGTVIVSSPFVAAGAQIPEPDRFEVPMPHAAGSKPEFEEDVEPEVDDASPTMIGEPPISFSAPDIVEPLPDDAPMTIVQPPPAAAAPAAEEPVEDEFGATIVQTRPKFEQPRAPAPAASPPVAAPASAPVAAAPAPTPAPLPRRPTTPAPAAARPAAPAPARAPRPAPPREAAAPRSKGGSKAPLILAAVVVVGGGVAAAMFVLSGQGTTPEPVASPATTEAGPGTAAPARGVAPATGGAAPADQPPPVAADPPPIEEIVSVVRPSPKVAAVPPGGVALPGAVPPGGRPGATAPVTTAPAAPVAPPPAVQAAALVQQAQAAANARNYEGAIGLYDQALTVDPGNAAAQAGKAAAETTRASLKRKFVPGRTNVQSTEKAKGGGLAGFDTSDVKVRQAPDFQGRVEFLMTPPNVKAGDAYKLQIALVNEGKKEIKISAVNVLMNINGKPLVRPVAPKTRDVGPQQRVILDELTGTWPADVKTWQTEVLVSAGKGESLKSQIAWR